MSIDGEASPLWYFTLYHMQRLKDISHTSPIHLGENPVHLLLMLLSGYLQSALFLLSSDVCTCKGNNFLCCWNEEKKDGFTQQKMWSFQSKDTFIAGNET